MKIQESEDILEYVYNNIGTLNEDQAKELACLCAKLYAAGELKGVNIVAAAVKQMLKEL